VKTDGRGQSAHALEIHMKSIATVITIVALAASDVALGASNFWARVRALEPGSHIVVRINGRSAPATRYFISADDASITLLNVTSPTLPNEAKRALRKLAARQSAELAAIERNVLLKDRVRIGPDGVFIANDKVATIDDVVETVARAEIVDVESGHRVATSHKIVIWTAIGIATFFLLVRWFVPYT
jgi:hypothetical protein